MPKFKIYAGLSGSFGGTQYHCTDDFIDHTDAERYARELAVEEYESYGGYHGLYTWDSMRQEIADELYDGDIEQVDPESVDERMIEEVENWMVYKVIPVHDDVLLDGEDEDDGYDDDDADCFCD
jgi:hypothetical protein